MGQMYFPDENPTIHRKAGYTIIIYIIIVVLMGYMFFILLDSLFETNNKKIGTNNKTSTIENSRNNTNNDIFTPTAEIKNVWIEKNIIGVDLYGNTISGFNINVNFVVYNYQGNDCKLQAFFYDKDFKNEIKGKNKKYQASTGCAYVNLSSNALYKASEWEKFPLFIPYEQLYTYNNNVISFIVIVRDKYDNVLAKKDILNVEYK